VQSCSCHSFLHSRRARCSPLANLSVAVPLPPPPAGSHAPTDTFIEPLQYLTCWVALNDATADNGCPWFIPSLFRRGPLPHDYDEINGGWTITGLRSDDAVCVPVAAGSIAVFWSLTPHLTGPNESAETRKAYIVQFAVDGFNNKIWDKAANDGAGGPMSPRHVEPTAVDERVNFLILKDGKAVAAPSLAKL
jgi:hypothetical protein